MQIMQITNKNKISKTYKMLFLLKKNIKHKYNFNKNRNGLMNISSDYANKKNTNSNIVICDIGIYKTDYNMNTIKKRVPHLFLNPSQDCYYFSSVGITNLRLTTYNDFMHDQAKLLFKVLNVYETAGKLRYAVFAGNSIGLVRAGRNLPWGDDYDLILFKNDIAFFSEYIIPELERIGFKIKLQIIKSIICGVKIFGLPIIFTQDNNNINNNINNNNNKDDEDASTSIFQCDVFYSYFDGKNVLKNCGGWGLYHEKNIPHNVIFPLKRRPFHGMLLPFFNNPLKEVELCYGNVGKCSIFSHHISSTIFYNKWEHAYKDFNHIKNISIRNTKKYISIFNKNAWIPSNSLALTPFMAPDLRDLLDNNNDNNDNNSFISRKLQLLGYLYKNNIGEIIVTPLHFLKNECITRFKIEADMPDYDYSTVGLKFIGEHAADIKCYFPQIKIIYDETGEGKSVFEDTSFLSLLHCKYVDVLRVNKNRCKVYQKNYDIAIKYGIKMPTIEIIENE
jgi:hypothetical protein